MALPFVLDTIKKGDLGLNLRMFSVSFRIKAI